MINSVSFGKRSIQTIECRQRAKEGLQLAEQVLRDTQNRFGRPRSSTYLRTKVSHHKNNPKYEQINNKLYNKSLSYDTVISFYDVKTVDRASLTDKKEDVYYGDCGHCTKAVQHEFWFKHHKPSVNVVMNVDRNNKFYCNHAFNISNIQKGMDITKPHTWGKETVVTDLWSGIALKSDDAINYFYKLFNVNPFEDSITFKTMPDFEGSLQKSFLKMNDIEYQGISY